MPVFGPKDAAVANEPDSAASGECTAAEAEEVQLVSGLVVVDQEAVALLDVARETDAEPAAEQPLASARADAGLVVQELRVAGAVLVCERKRDLGHVRRSGNALINMVWAIPGPIAADDQTLHGSARP